ncbi:MAG: metalloregulator ArsR/SmtB family transcription factor [Gemmatimonadota bacterium]
MNRRPLLRGIAPELLLRAAETIKLLGHPERLKIVEALEEEPRSVSELCRICGLDQPICSQHLCRLRRHGVVVAKRRGQHVVYRVVDAKVSHILSCIRTCDARRSA